MNEITNQLAEILERCLIESFEEAVKKVYGDDELPGVEFHFLRTQQPIREEEI